jgi:hypothetical protein
MMMGSLLSKLKHASDSMVFLRGKRQFNRRHDMHNDIALTQINISSETPVVARPLKIRSKRRRHSNTIPGELVYPNQNHTASHRLSQMTARTSITDPDGVFRRFSTPEELAEADR